MNCQDCGREFCPKKNQTLCIACKYDKTRAKYKAKRDANKVAKVYPLEECPACNHKFEKRAKDQNYCNESCAIIMENKKFNKRWGERKPSKILRRYRKQFDISKTWFMLKKYSACRG